MSTAPGSPPPDPLPPGSTPPPPAKKSKVWLYVLIGVLSVPLCCCGSVLFIMFKPRTGEVVLSNPRGGLGQVTVDYVIPGGPDRRVQYCMRIETADGGQYDWLFRGDLGDRGTLSNSGPGPGIPLTAKRPWKVYLCDDRSGKTRISNIVEIP